MKIACGTKSEDAELLRKYRQMTKYDARSEVETRNIIYVRNRETMWVRLFHYDEETEATYGRYRCGLMRRRGGERRRSGDRREWCSVLLPSSLDLSSLAGVTLPSSPPSFSVSDSATSITSDSGTGMLSSSRRSLSFLMRRFIRSSFCQRHMMEIVGQAFKQG